MSRIWRKVLLWFRPRKRRDKRDPRSSWERRLDDGVIASRLPRWAAKRR